MLPCVLQPKPSVVIAALGLALATSLPARAQDGPHGAVETCQVHYVQDSFSDCELCAATLEAPAACSTRLAPLGYVKKCRTQGGHQGFSEIWCLDRRPGE